MRTLWSSDKGTDSSSVVAAIIHRPFELDLAGSRFVNPRLSDRSLHRPLQTGLIDLVTPLHTRTRVDTSMAGWKYIPLKDAIHTADAENPKLVFEKGEMIFRYTDWQGIEREIKFFGVVGC